MKNSIKPVMINGINVYPFNSYDEFLEYIHDKSALLIALNAGKLDRSTPEMKYIINKNIGYCDGIGATIALKKKGYKCPTITGVDLWTMIIDRYHKERTFYLIGGSQEVIDSVVRRLKTEYPNINIVGYRNGYIKSDEERTALLEDVKTKQPNVVFVAMGSPKQENLMAEMQKVNPNAIYQGLGGSFDIYAGKVKRTPKWIRNLHCEGIYRGMSRVLIKEHRYRFTHDIIFVIKIILGFVK